MCYKVTPTRLTCISAAVLDSECQEESMKALSKNQNACRALARDKYRVAIPRRNCPAVRHIYFSIYKLSITSLNEEFKEAGYCKWNCLSLEVRSHTDFLLYIIFQLQYKTKS